MEQVKEKEKEIKNKKLKLILIILVTISGLVAYFIHSSTEINPWYGWSIFFISIIFLVISFVSQNIAEKLKGVKNSNVPEPITQKQAFIRVEKDITSLRRHIKKGTVPLPYSESFNDNVIYAFHVELHKKYKGLGDSCWIIINATYPSDIDTFAKGSLSWNSEEIKQIMNSKSRKKEVTNTTVTEISSDTFGGQNKTTTEVSHQQEKEKENVQ